MMCGKLWEMFVITRREAIASPSTGFTLSRASTVFTRSAKPATEVNRFGQNLGHSEYIVCHWSRQIWARSAQKRERDSEAKFCFFWSGKQRAISPTSHQPNFTKFAHKTWISEVVNPLGTEFWKFSRKGLFFLKRQINFGPKSPTTCDFRPL